MSHNQAAGVIEQNTTVVINMVNAAIKQGQLPGISSIPSGSHASSVEKTLNAALVKSVEDEWKAAFPSAGTPSNFDFAFFQGPAVLDPTMKVPNAVDAINTNLNSWGIATRAGFAENVVHTVLLNLVMAGGIVASSHGSQIIGPAQTTDWACATITGQAGSGDDVVHLIGYVFTAAEVDS